MFTVIAQSVVWDEEVGPGSYCTHVRALATDDLDIAKDYADTLRQNDRERDPDSPIYYTLRSWSGSQRGRVVYRTSL
jgi:hypothetical protein